MTNFFRSLSLASIVAVLCLSMVVVPLTGCAPISAAQVAEDGRAISAALNAVAAIEAVTNPTVAADLRVAAGAIVSSTADWQTGDSTALIFSTLEGATSALAQIDPNSKLGQLAAIAFVAITVLQAVLPAAPLPLTVTAKVSKPNPYANTTVTIPHHKFRSRAYDFETAWNKVANSDPALASAVIK